MMTILTSENALDLMQKVVDELADKDEKIASLERSLADAGTFCISYFELMNAYAERPHGDGVGGTDPNAVLAHGYAIIANLNNLIKESLGG